MDFDQYQQQQQRQNSEDESANDRTPLGKLHAENKESMPGWVSASDYNKRCNSASRQITIPAPFKFDQRQTPTKQSFQKLLAEKETPALFPHFKAKPVPPSVLEPRLDQIAQE